jgi:hypothetical protein
MRHRHVDGPIGFGIQNQRRIASQQQTPNGSRLPYVRFRMDTYHRRLACGAMVVARCCNAMVLLKVLRRLVRGHTQQPYP